MGLFGHPFSNTLKKIGSWFTGVETQGYCFKCRIYNHSCRSCGQLFCRNCSHCGSERSILCKICSHAVDCHESSPDSPLLRFNKSGLSNFSNVSSPQSTRVDEEDSGEDMEKDFFSAPSELSQDSSDIDSASTTRSFDMQGFLSADSSPLCSPTTDFNHALSDESTSNPESPSYFRKTRDDCKNSLENSPESKHESLYGNNANQRVQKQLDFEKNELIWEPPSPEDEDDDVENGFFGYDDDDDNDDSKSNSYFSCGSFSSRSLSIREKHDDAHKEQFRNSVHVHFKALVSQLLTGEGIQILDKDGSEGWLDIVSSLAWQAATFVKPDNSKGGNMEPGNSVKVKCILSGNPTDSKFVKGVVCAKNIKHKRMISQYKNPRLFLLSGALEYEKPTNKLASINTVLKQETDQLNIALSKIEAYKPNVLLVEKSVSSFAQDYLLKKEISLVLNVKQTLLERIARCTGANIATNIDNIARARLGHCEMFRVEKFEEYSSKNNPNKKPIKSLMFFEGCPWHFGCTVLLHGSNIEELKKVKRIVQYASFAAYHLSRETSYLVDEGGALPKLPQNALKMLKSSVISDKIQTVNCHNFQPELYVKDHAKGLNHLIEEEGNLREGGMLEQLEENGNLNYFSAANSHSILVSLSTSCVSKGTICESSKLMRINFYGSFDKPLGRYLCDDLFDQKLCCRNCKQRSEAHVRCYTNQYGCLKISVHRYSSIKLPGERDGRIWMWHRCLECEYSNDVPPAVQRVVMSDAAWSLSFGKFLELSFSNHASANRVAICGHSLQKDCLHFYGSGSMVACFQYSPVDILSVQLPPLVLNFSCNHQQELVKGEATDIMGKIDILQSDVNEVLQRFEHRISTSDNEPVKADIYKYIMELQDLLKRERKEYEVFLAQETVDILELNRLKRILLIDAYTWSRGLDLLDSFSASKTSTLKSHSLISKDSIDYSRNFKIFPVENITYPSILEHYFSNCIDRVSSHTECETSIGRRPSVGSVLSDNIDSIWNGNPDSDTLVSIRLLNDPLYINERFASLHLSSVRSFDALENLNGTNASQLFSKLMSSVCNIVNDGVRFMLPQKGNDELVIALYDNELSTLISYAISSADHFEFVNRDRQPCKETHFRISFDDDPSMPKEKMKFSVTSYFAKQFSTLRKKCFPNESDFLRSMSRCKSWNAQGGKSHVYFAKSFDERFILKQVTKTELDSFELFASDYFKYMTESLDAGSPTCLAKCFGVYQVSVRKAGREVKTDLMVSENVFYGRKISKVYDLKGSLRARYNPVTSGIDTVLLDENLLEILKSKPIFLGSKAKRNLDRAVWNDTYFLASIDVMDYSLLVGIDDEKKELVVGIIDYMRQYTWDKHLETWVKLSGILGGPKNEAPTIISPLQYKKRFRKAMSRYFLTLPDP